jgi:hypothetical protein
MDLAIDERDTPPDNRLGLDNGRSSVESKSYTNDGSSPDVVVHNTAYAGYNSMVHPCL